jgi:hypothetical protein
MSFINKGKQSATMQEQTAASQVKRSKIQMKIDVVPIPTGASSVSSPEKRAAQQRSINQIKTQGKDLFEVNSTMVTDSGSNRLYQTVDLYSESLPLEELIPMLTSANLTLKLNALRYGKQSSNTCMELKTGHLADIIEKTPVDERNEKTCNVSLQTSKERGSMFVGVKCKGGKHFIQKLDFEIHRDEDNKLHIDD